MYTGGDHMRLKQLRESRGLSQNRLAKLSGVSQVYISKMEIHNQKSAGFEILRKLANVLECRVEDLLDEPDKEAKERAS